MAQYKLKQQSNSSDVEQERILGQKSENSGEKVQNLVVEKLEESTEKNNLEEAVEVPESDKAIQSQNQVSFIDILELVDSF